jgi:tRNA-guanine family transglycosylase
MLSKEILGATLLSLHNVFLLIHLASEIRESILQGKFSVLLEEFREVPSEPG